MTQATRSMLAWTIYVVAVGLGLFLVPDAILGLFHIEETDESWVRVAGLLVLTLAILYGSMVRTPSRASFESAVYARWFAAVGLTVLAFTAGPWQLALFAAVDFAGATWTFFALRSEPRPEKPA